MSLIICSECGKEFSDKAKACPNCGCPTECVIEANNAVSSPTKEQISDIPEPAKTTVVQEEKQRMSYAELKEFCFSSVLPYIKKELNTTELEVKAGNGSSDDVHYYIRCNNRTIGIKVKIDAYPDVYNVGKWFNDDRDVPTLAKKMASMGYEFAVANIGIGAADPLRFKRRVFLKNDGYYFNYNQLVFIDPAIYDNPIRYSLSEAEPDEEWKEIAGLPYKRKSKKPAPGSPAALFGIEKPEEKKDISKSIEYHQFWKNRTTAESVVENICKEYQVVNDDLTLLKRMICVIGYASYTSSISAEDAVAYVGNAIDFVQGRFLSDSETVPNGQILSVLKELISNSKEIAEHEYSCWVQTAINYLIYLYCTDRSALRECIQCYYDAVNPDDRPLKVTADKMEKDFWDNPMLFGYGQDVVDELKRIQHINSKENLDKYAEMKTSIITNMKQYDVVHEMIHSKKERQELSRKVEALLSVFSKEIVQLKSFIGANFNDSLAREHLLPMKEFLNMMDIYQKCLGMDTVIIERIRSGKYGFFERRDDLKESKCRYDALMRERT